VIQVLGLPLVLASCSVVHRPPISRRQEDCRRCVRGMSWHKGVSVNETTPDLAAQRAGYLEAQLKAYKGSTRKLPGGTSPRLL
jgi:hypothetical protein